MIDIENIHDIGIEDISTQLASGIIKQSKLFFNY